MKLNLLTKGRKYADNGRGRRFYTSVDMSIIKHDIAVKNAKLKRGKIAYRSREIISPCGCGIEGCFIHASI